MIKEFIPIEIRTASTFKEKVLGNKSPNVEDLIL